MSLTPEQVMATHKGNMETLFGLANKAFDGLEKWWSSTYPLRAPP